MASHADEGQRALAARDYGRAIELYTQALKTSNSPVWLTQRSVAFLRNKQYEESLIDAESALLEAVSRGRREYMASAQMRRAIALYSLGRYGDARMCLTWVRKLNEKEPGLGMWQEKVRSDYEKLPENDPAQAVIVKETPDKAETDAKRANFKTTDAANIWSSTVTKVPVSTSQTDTSKSPTKTLASSPQAATEAAQQVHTQTPIEKIRQEWFQSSNKVTVTIFAKNVPKDKIDIHYDINSLSISFPTGTPGVDYDFTAMPLFSTIDVAKSTHAITANKIEINLHKEMPGLKWAKLEGDMTAESKVKQDGTSMSPLATNATFKSQTTTKASAPVYPTSSRSGPKNWDSLSKEALKELNKAGSSEASSNVPDLDSDDDSGGEGDSRFFKKLYKDANPDTRRAMMKSYVESNGTALNTDWSQVSKERVEISPPSGLEAKKWES